MAERRNIPIARPATGEDEWQAMRESIMSGWLTQGPKVAEFETAFARYHQAKHALATCNCTTALHLILAAMGIGPGDEVIVPAFTWVATANAVLYCGATPVFVDVERDTFNMSPAQVAEKVTQRTRVIMPAHLFGLCADVDAIVAVASGVPIVCDAACASGAGYKGRPAGTVGIASGFSFHPRKPITTGEGGMITTDSDELAEKIDAMRNHGASMSEERRHGGRHPYVLPEFNVLGYNYRMTDLQGALGLTQLAKLDGFMRERRQWAKFYDEQLAAVPWLRTPVVPQYCDHGWQAYVCYVDETKAPMSRNASMEQLLAKGINTRPGTHAVHMLGLYRQWLGLREDDFPVSRDCDRFTMALPLHNCMTIDDLEYVVDAIKAI